MMIIIKQGTERYDVSYSYASSVTLLHFESSLYPVVLFFSF